MSYRDDSRDNDLRKLLNNVEDEAAEEEAVEEIDNMVTLNDEEGNEVQFEFLDLIDYKGEQYVVLLPPGDDEVLILKLEEGPTEDLESYSGVDDEETLMAVFEIFKEKFADEFTFTDK